MALGAPGLEDIYDLRPYSTLTRCMQDTPTGKSVEITLRRWQTPSPHQAGMPHMMGYPQAHSFVPPSHPGHLSAIGVLQQQAAGLSTSSTAAGHYGHPMYNQYSPAAAPASPPRWEAELTSRLSRLEGALSSLKPQIEVLLTQPQQQLNHGQASHSQLAGSSDDVAVRQHASHSQSPERSPKSGKTSLANRRGAASLAIETLSMAQTANTAKPTVQASKPALAPLQIATKSNGIRPVVMPEMPAQGGASPKDGEVETAAQRNSEPARSGGSVSPKDGTRRPAVSVNPCRMAPGAQDPQSPRSPGRYSAWK